MGALCSMVGTHSIEGELNSGVYLLISGEEHKSHQNIFFCSQVERLRLGQGFAIFSSNGGEKT